MNHYAILGVDEFCSLEDIKESYKNLSKKYHPNSLSEERSTEKYIELKTSYDFLIKNHKPKTITKSHDHFNGELFFRVLDTEVINGMLYSEIFFDFDYFENKSKIHLMMWDKEFTVTFKAGTKIPNTIDVFLPEAKQPLRLKISKGYK